MLASDRIICYNKPKERIARAAGESVPKRDSMNPREAVANAL